MIQKWKENPEEKHFQGFYRKKFTKYTENSQQKKPLLWMYTLNTN
jgi:hypothetical protein